MSDFRYVVDIKVSPQRVWEIMLDVERWPEWTTSVIRVQRLEIGPLTLGSRTRIHQPKLRPTVWCVTSLDEQRRTFAWTARNIGIKVVARHQVEPTKTGSRATLSIHYSGVLGLLFARLYRDLNWDYLAREGNGLRKRCETPKPAATAAR